VVSCLPTYLPTVHKQVKSHWPASSFEKKCSISQELLILTFSLPESVMDTIKLVLTFESVDEILWCDHSNETSLAVVSHGTIYIKVFYKMVKFLDLSCIVTLGTLGSKSVKVLFSMFIWLPCDKKSVFWLVRELDVWSDLGTIYVTNPKTMYFRLCCVILPHFPPNVRLCHESVLSISFTFLVCIYIIGRFYARDVNIV